MKKTITLTTRKLFTMLIAFLTLAGTTSAQPVYFSNKGLPDEPLTVKYLGSDNDYLLFEIMITTTDSKHPVLNIEDANAGRLFSETLKSNVKAQTIKIEKRDNQDLSFELVAGKKMYCKSFIINTSIVQKTLVTEGQVVTR